MTTHRLAGLLTVTLADLPDARRVVRERMPAVVAAAYAETREAVREGGGATGARA